NKGIQVIVLNPGDLATIYQSLKKQIKKTLSRLRDSYNVFNRRITGRSDPNDEEEDNRRLCTEQENWTRQLTQSKNRLHSLFTQAGLTHITKKLFKNKSK
ncbi:hypothetical protein LEP1GSC029_4213, partial [Leptospira interrogans str. 2002000626]